MEDVIAESAEIFRLALEDIERQGFPQLEPVNRLAHRLAKRAGVYPILNLAVELCLKAYVETMKKYLTDNSGPGDRQLQSQVSYCAFLPHLSDRDSIRDFIACIVHGMAIGAIATSEGTRLLYGAQVAIAALPSKKRYQKHPKTTTNAPGNQIPTPAPSIT